VLGWAGGADGFGGDGLVDSEGGWLLGGSGARNFFPSASSATKQLCANPDPLNHKF